jgi:hypothetical protein
MSVRIYYEFKSSENDPALARKQVDELRQRALRLPFKHVGKIRVLTGDKGVYEQGCDKLHSLAAMNRNGVNEPLFQPMEIIAFEVSLLNGCEPAWFGLRRSEGYDWEAVCKTGDAKF